MTNPPLNPSFWRTTLVTALSVPLILAIPATANAKGNDKNNGDNRNEHAVIAQEQKGQQVERLDPYGQNKDNRKELYGNRGRNNPVPDPVIDPPPPPPDPDPVIDPPPPPDPDPVIDPPPPPTPDPTPTPDPVPSPDPVPEVPF